MEGGTEKVRPLRRGCQRIVGKSQMRAGSDPPELNQCALHAIVGVHHDAAAQPECQAISDIRVKIGLALLLEFQPAPNRPPSKGLISNCCARAGRNTQRSNIAHLLSTNPADLPIRFMETPC